MGSQEQPVAPTESDGGKLETHTPIAAVVAAAEARHREAQPPPSVHHLDAVIMEGKRKFNNALEDELLDYKHNHVIKIEGCANTLIRMFGNVLEHPDEDKFKRIKGSSNVFKNNVSSIKGGEHLMTLAGWRTEVVDLEKYWVWTDGAPGSHKHAILYEAHRLLTKALGLIHEKAERKRHEAEEKQAAEKARLASVMAALDEDRLERRIRQQIGQDSSVPAPESVPASVPGTLPAPQE